MKSTHKRQTATLKDIAEATGYSINTVSRALRDKDDISVKTRAKIKSTALEMRHVNNMIASSLRLGYTNTIAVIISDVSNPYFAITMKEIEVCARQLGYTTFIINTNEDNDSELEAIQASLNKNVDGIILCPAQKSEKNILYLKETGVPFVLLGRRYKQIETDYVVSSDEFGGYQATSYLLDHGHKDILMLSGPTYLSSARERQDGYRRAITERNMKIKEELIWEVPVITQGFDEILERVLDRKVNFTAVFTYSDIIAWATWSYLRKKGYTIGKDFSIIGYDYIQSRLTYPFELSTIDPHKERMSKMAVEFLFKRIKGEQSESQYFTAIVETVLVEGETVQNLRNDSAG